MKRLLEFLSLGVIIGPLPNVIANGQPIDATPLMADLNWIVSQVNANAQAAGAFGEWVAPGVSPSFISATQFSVPGDLTAIFDKRRRILLTVTAVNGGATVTNSSFGAGITTVTCTTDTGGFLTAGLTAVQYALLDAAILSTPRKTCLSILTTTLGINLTTGTGYWIGQGSPWPQDSVINDVFSENSSGQVTVKNAGLYLCTVGATWAINGATVTLAGSVSVDLNAVAQSGTTSIDKQPNFTFIQANATSLVNCAANDVLRGQVNTPTFTGGPMQSRGGTFSVVQVYP